MIINKPSTDSTNSTEQTEQTDYKVFSKPSPNTKPDLSFNNDLTDKEKEDLIARYITVIRKILNEPTITCNQVARIINWPHKRVSLAKKNNSLSEFLHTVDQNPVLNKVRGLTKELSDDEKKLLLMELQSHKLG